MTAIPMIRMSVRLTTKRPVDGTSDVFDSRGDYGETFSSSLLGFSGATITIFFGNSECFSPVSLSIITGATGLASSPGFVVSTAVPSLAATIFSNVNESSSAN